MLNTLIIWLIVYSVYPASGVVLSSLTTPVQPETSTKKEVNSKQRRNCKHLTSNIFCYENVTFVVRHHRTDTTLWQYGREIEIHFVAFGKMFVLVLHAERPKHTSQIFHRRFSVTVIDDTERRIVGYDSEHYFSGYLSDEPSSMFRGKYYEGILDVVIHTSVATYYVEPCMNYFNCTVGTYSAVVYTDTDMDWSLNSDVGTHVREYDFSHKTTKQTRRHFTKMFAANIDKGTHKSERWRRQAIHPLHKVCELTVIVDHSFYNIRSGGSVVKTVDSVVFALKLADHSFRRVDFGTDRVGDNVGFAIRELIIYTDANSSEYRLGNSSSPKAVLVALATYDFNRSCLGVLFTHRKFNSSVTGLAYIGCSNDACFGGLCQQQLRRGEKFNSYNALLVSSLKDDTQLSSRALARTLTHQLGHAFGAPDDTAECMPGGKYGMHVMHAGDSSDSKSNSFTFSQCSIDAMRPLVEGKGSCLKTVTEHKYCGNFVREPGEECDCGTDPKLCGAVDKCCVPPSDLEPGCRIAREQGYVCSPKAAPCCTDECLVMTDARECRAKTDCVGAAMCNSNSSECPDSAPLPDGTPCAGGVNVCSRGECSLGRCAAHGWIDCRCNDVTEELCQLCCSSGNVSCKPAFNLSDKDDLLKPIYRNVPDLCMYRTGYCDANHVCVPFAPQRDNALEKSFWSKTFALFAAYWWCLLLALILALLFMQCMASFGRREETQRALEYRVGRNKAYMMLWADHVELADQFRHLELEYIDELRRVNEDQPVDYVVALARLCFMFPTAPTTDIIKAARSSNCEEQAFRWLLLMGHPVKTRPDSRPVSPVSVEKQDEIVIPLLHLFSITNTRCSSCSDTS